MKIRIALVPFVVWLGACLPAAVFAATITVNTANDEFNTDGDCSLREAVDAANEDIVSDGCIAGSGDDVITFAPELTGATINLVIGGAESATTGDIDIFGEEVDGTLTIQGPVAGDAGAIVIDGNETTRIFDVPTQAQLPVLTLANLTVQNGRVEAPNAQGGGIRVLSEDTRLVLDHVRVIDNQVVASAGDARGGGIYTVGPFSFTNSVISGNAAHAVGVNAPRAAGGGFQAAFADESTDNAVESVEISANSATSDNGPAFGGGAFLGASLGESQTGNQPPTVTAPIADQSFLTTDSNGVSFDLTTVFDDPDGDALSFQSSVADADVASAVVNGTEMVVEPTGTGATSVTVTAIDGQGGTAATAFMVTVGEPPNQPPVVDNDIPNQAFALGDADVSVNLTGIFSDPDGDPLSFGAVSSDANVATATVNGNLLTIGPEQPGSATVDVTANDGSGGTVSTQILVTVSQPQPPPNSPPIVVSPIADLPGNNQSTFVINLGPVFMDPDGDPLSYTASSSFPGTASATVNGNQLEVIRQTMCPFDATISVTASDGNGGFVTDEFVANTGGGCRVVRPSGAGNANPGTTSNGGFVALQIANAPVQVRFRNTTISGNSVAGSGAGEAAGGGLFLRGALGVGLNNVTIAQNTVASADGAGGGFAVSNAEIELSNTIVAGNAAATGPDCAALAGPVDGAGSGVVTSAGFNLIGNGSACALEAMAGDQVGTAAAAIDPLLGALGDNGGGSQTHALQLGSAAIDAANPAAPGSAGASCETTDQRGQPRPVDGDRSATAECDVGAYEAAVNQPPTVISLIPDQTLIAGADGFSIDLADVFEDPESGALQYSASSSNPAVATASISGTELTITPVSPGSASITATATDNLGALRQLRIAVANPSNRAGPGGAGGAGAGGGCTLVVGATGFDPLLWLLFLLCAAWCCHRRWRGPEKPAQARAALRLPSLRPRADSDVAG